MDDANPLTQDWFNWQPKEHIPFEPHKHVPSMVPEVNKLFAIQKDLLKAVNFIEGAGHEGISGHEFAALRANVENAYRQLVNYLKTNTAGPGGGTF